MSFGAAVHKFADKSDWLMSEALRKIALGAFTEVIMMSPVDTGRFRGNWQVSVGPELEYIPPVDDEDPSGSATVAYTKSIVDTLNAGDTVWLVNNLPYAGPLEYGWSKQAPGGMVRLTAQRWKPIVEEVGRQLARQANG